jgi:hypothetical protein
VSEPPLERFGMAMAEEKKNIEGGFGPRPPPKAETPFFNFVFFSLALRGSQTVGPQGWFGHRQESKPPS